MSTDPEVIRAQIAATRADLSNNVNELEDKVSPSHIAKRQTDRLREGVTSVKNHIMGAAEEVKTSAQDSLSSAGSGASNAPGRIAGQTQGNPVAAGLIAFGAGMLLSALIPASKPEAKAAAAIKEQAQPLVQELTEAAKDTAANLQEPAQEAVESVKSTATEAVEKVKDQGADAVAEVKDQAVDAKDAVQEQSKS